MIRTGIITLSDKASRGDREDRSGPLIREVLGEIQAEVQRYEVIPDEPVLLEERLRQWSRELDLIVTTGGTGIGPRDRTPEATRRVIDRELPGYGEIMRVKSFEVTPKAVISRSMAGVAGHCLIINLPGSPKAVGECLGFVLPAIPHTIEMARGEGGECARRDDDPGA